MFNMKKVGAFLSVGAVSVATFASHAFAATTTIDISAATDAMDAGNAAAVGLVGKGGLLGIALVLAVIAAAIGIVFIRMGFKKGLKALHGKV